MHVCLDACVVLMILSSRWVIRGDQEGPELVIEKKKQLIEDLDLKKDLSLRQV